MSILFSEEEKDENPPKKKSSQILSNYIEVSPKTVQHGTSIALHSNALEGATKNKQEGECVGLGR